MAQLRRLRLWFALALTIVIIAAAVLGLHSTLPSSHHSPLPTPVTSGILLLPTPSTTASAPPISWTGGGAVLLWVVMGIVLALGIVFILHWHHRAV